MKNKLPVWLSAVIALVLVAFGLFYGTWMGYREDRAEVTGLLEMENGLMDVLGYRAADGLNLCVVAGRHLPQDDAGLTALHTAAQALRDAKTLSRCKAADEELAKAVTDISAQLQQTPSFQQSQRDQSYLAMLTADLDNLSASAAISTYNDAASDFNRKLDAPLSGALARLLGMEACPLYQ